MHRGTGCPPWVWTACLVVLGCGDGERGGRTDGSAAGAISASGAAAAASATAGASASGATAPADPAVRTRGPVSGSLRFDAPSYALGAPMLLEIEVKNPGPEGLVFDDRMAHTVMVVRDESGAVLCDHGGRSPRLGSEFVGTIELAPGETYHETHLANGMCGAFGRAGKYQVSALRYVVKTHAGGPPRACETLAPSGVAPTDADGDCAEAVSRFHAVAIELTVEVRPWDKAALAARASQVEAERKAAYAARDLSREGALSAYADWFCDNVRCSCPAQWDRHGHWAVGALGRVPDAMGEGCRP